MFKYYCYFFPVVSTWYRVMCTFNGIGTDYYIFGIVTLSNIDISNAMIMRISSVKAVP